MRRSCRIGKEGYKTHPCQEIYAGSVRFLSAAVISCPPSIRKLLSAYCIASFSWVTMNTVFFCSWT